MEKNIELLRVEFEGSGEVGGMLFKQIIQSDNGYIYEVNGESTHYEVFKRKNTPICIDFDKRIYSETNFKEVYPKSKDFGVWAYTCANLEQAENKLKTF